jgi:hypothetical protein
MDLTGKVRVADGATRAIADDTAPADSEGARMIIREALRDDPRPLHVAFLGPLTDMASAILLEPRIVHRNVRVVWIGGGHWPVGGREYNLLNDITGANVVFRSGIEIWQIPMTVYRMMAVGYAELYERVYDKGAIGKYLVEQLVDWNTRMVAGPIEHRSLGDSPAIGVIMYPECGRWEYRPGPQWNDVMNYVHTGQTGRCGCTKRSTNALSRRIFSQSWRASPAARRNSPASTGEPCRANRFFDASSTRKCSTGCWRGSKAGRSPPETPCRRNEN